MIDLSTAAALWPSQGVDVTDRPSKFVIVSEQGVSVFCEPVSLKLNTGTRGTTALNPRTGTMYTNGRNLAHSQPPFP
eukprot:scaffold1879_cov178-Amphora_coffeaeformis.AAC.1